MIQAVIVGLSNGEIRLYNDKNLVTTLKTDVIIYMIILFQDIVCGLVFGVFGREEGCLIMNNKSGGLTAKILQR